MTLYKAYIYGRHLLYIGERTTVINLLRDEKKNQFQINKLLRK